MKILHVNTEKGWRGGEQQLFYLAKGLLERGIETAVACRKGEELEKRCKEEGILTFPLKGNQSSDVLRLGILGKEFDIIHAHTAKAHTLAALSKPIHKKKVVYTRRVDFLPKNNPITKLKYNLTDKVIAITNFVAEIITKSLNLNEEKLKVINSAVERNLPDKVNPDVVKNFRNKFKGKKIIGSVAALTEQKNIPNLINAAKITLKTNKDLVFVVFGKGKLENYIRSIIKKEKLENHFILAGFKKDIHNYIKAFDIFVLPSDYEGLGSSILSAMILKVPVVATNTGGIPEVIENGKTGLLVPRRNPVKLAHAILKLLKDEELKSKLISNAYRKVVDNFTVDRMIDAYIKVYGEVVSDRSVMGEVLK